MPLRCSNIPRGSLLHPVRRLPAHGRPPRQVRSAALVVRHYNTPVKPPSSSKPPISDQPAPQAFQTGKDEPLVRRLAHAWRTTPTKWYPLPLTVGALLLCALAWKKSRDDARRRPHVIVDEEGEVLKVQGPWQVHVLGALPLRQLSRLWGYFNNLELPVWFRPYGFRLYASVFGANLEEMDPPDLKAYKSLGEFFYRRLKDGARPIANAPLVSPADGTMVHMGIIEGRRVEQVKGVTYSLDALLGLPSGSSSPPISTPLTPQSTVQDEEFANVNGIPYSLDELTGMNTDAQGRNKGDASVPQQEGLDGFTQQVQVLQTMGTQALVPAGEALKEGNKLYYCVVYLAPGDYHRFHSPASWVVEKRRHFSGELFSVNPWLVQRMQNLFVLNERVALLGKWRYGFFGFVPIGATNVGSIKINFDSDLRTNTASRRPPVGTYVEASYALASRILGGQPLTAGQEMGGFALGSTIVVVFEGPEGWRWRVREGEKVRVGQALGEFER